MKLISTEIFSGRAANYAATRPTYSPKILRAIKYICPPPAVVADIGAGTGIFSRGLVEIGYTVRGVEPNAQMRSEAIAKNQMKTALSIAEGTAESTGLETGSVDLITTAQAFHWFDPQSTKDEFRRIGKPRVLAAIVWNSRQFNASQFMRDYQQMLVNHSATYTRMRDQYWKDLDSKVAAFLSSSAQRFEYDHSYRLDRNKFLGSLLSTSYVPKECESGHDEFVLAAYSLFDQYQRDGSVLVHQATIAHVGNIR